MASKLGHGKREPLHFRDRSRRDATGPRFDKLSKADWADAFCDLYQQVFGESATAVEMLADAERRIANLKQQGIR